MVLYGTAEGATEPVKIVCETEGNLIMTTDKSIDTNMIFNGGAWPDGYAHLVDCNGYRAIRLWGATTAVLDVSATNATNTGNITFWMPFDATPATGTFNFYYRDPPRYLRLTNNTGAPIAVTEFQFARFK